MKTRMKSSNKPKQIKLRGVKIAKISCGSNHSLLLSSDSHIYALAEYKFTGYLNKCDLNYVEYNRKILDTLRQIYVYKLSGTYNDIESHSSCCIVSVSTQTGNKYKYWGKNEFKSFSEAFENLLQITYDKKNDRLIEFDYQLTRDYIMKCKHSIRTNWAKTLMGKYSKPDKWEDLNSLL